MFLVNIKDDIMDVSKDVKENLPPFPLKKKILWTISLPYKYPPSPPHE